MLLTMRSLLEQQQGGGGGGGGETPTFVNIARSGQSFGGSNLTTTFAFTAPANIVAGNLLIAFVASAGASLDTNSGLTSVDIPGWIAFNASTAVPTGLSLLYKIADAGDVGAASFTGNLTRGASGTSHAALIAQFSGVDPTNPLDDSPQFAARARPLSLPGETTVTSGALPLAFIGLNAGTSTMSSFTVASGWTAVSAMTNAAAIAPVGVYSATEGAVAGSSWTWAGGTRTGTGGVITALRPASSGAATVSDAFEATAEASATIEAATTGALTASSNSSASIISVDQQIPAIVSSTTTAASLVTPSVPRLYSPTATASSSASITPTITTPVVSLTWQGHTWTVRQNTGQPGPTSFDSQQAWIDVNGYLNLRFSQLTGGWRGAEVNQSDGVVHGYGEYRWVYDVTPAMDPNLVLGLFVYDNDPAASPSFREIDIEISRWSNASAKNHLWYTLQPGGLAFMGTATENRVAGSPLTGAAMPLTSSFIWEAGQVYWKTTDANGVLIAEHLVNEGVQVPSTTGPDVMMNLWSNGGTTPGAGTTVTLRSFTFTAGATHQPAPAATFVEDFSDVYNWMLGDTSSITTGELVLPAFSSYSSNALSGNLLDMRNSTVMIENTQWLNFGGNNSQEMQFHVRHDADNLFMLMATPGQLMARTRIAGVNTESWGLAVPDPVAHKYWRVSTSGTTVNYQVSANGNTWTNLVSHTFSLSAAILSSMRAALYSGYWGTETNVGEWHVNAVNPSTVVSVSGSVAPTANASAALGGIFIDVRGVAASAATASAVTTPQITRSGAEAATAASSAALSSTVQITRIGSLTVTSTANSAIAPLLTILGVVLASSATSKSILGAQLTPIGSVSATALTSNRINVVQYGALSVTSTGTVTLFPQLLVNSAVFGTASASSTVTPALAIPGGLISTVTASPTVGIQITRIGLLTTTGGASGTIAGQIVRSGVLVFTAATSAFIDVQILHSGNLTSTGNASSTVDAQILRTGALNSNSTASSTINVQFSYLEELAANAGASAGISSAVQRIAALTAAATGSTSFSGLLTISRALIGTTAASGVLSSQLTVVSSLTATVSTSSVLSAFLTSTGTLTATTNTNATASSALQRMGTLNVAVIASGAIASLLTTASSLTTTGTAAAAVTPQLTVYGGLNASAPGTVVLSGVVGISRVLSSTTSANAVLTPQVVILGLLTSTTAAAMNVAAQLISSSGVSFSSTGIVLIGQQGSLLGQLTSNSSSFVSLLPAVQQIGALSIFGATSATIAGFFGFSRALTAVAEGTGTVQPLVTISRVLAASGAATGSINVVVYGVIASTGATSALIAASISVAASLSMSASTSAAVAVLRTIPGALTVSVDGSVLVGVSGQIISILTSTSISTSAVAVNVAVVGVITSVISGSVTIFGTDINSRALSASAFSSAFLTTTLALSGSEASTAASLAVISTSAVAGTTSVLSTGSGVMAIGVQLTRTGSINAISVTSMLTSAPALGALVVYGFSQAIIVPVIGASQQITAQTLAVASISSLFDLLRQLSATTTASATTTSLVQLSRFLAATGVALVITIRRFGGTAGGSWTESGAATGLVHRRGSSTSTWSEDTTVLGVVLRIGTASGRWQIIGLARSGSIHHGVAVGDVTWSFVPIGVTPALKHFGTAVGFWSFTGATFGLSPHIQITFILDAPLSTRSTTVDSITTRETAIQSIQTRDMQIGRIQTRSTEHEPARKRTLVAQMEDR